MKSDSTLDSQTVMTGPTGVGSAVGVSDSKWYIALVKNNTEKISGQRLTQAGYENYVASQQLVRVWRNGRRATVDTVVLRSIVFVRCTEQQRRRIVQLPYILRFMTNRAASGQALATVSDSEIDKLRFMLGQTDIPVTFQPCDYRHGQAVRVLRGSLAGLTGEIADIRDGKGQLMVIIQALGNATLTIDTINVEPLD